MEISKTECKRILRTLELKAYRSVVDALRAQGTLTASKHEVLKNLAATLKVGEERYRSEIRRAANDDLLNTIAQCTSGEKTETEWRAESVKKVPLTPMIASHTAFTVLADAISDIVSLENEKFSSSGKVNNVIESYKSQKDENLEKYQSSKVLDSLLRKRKNHHENSILSELENIKENNNYHSSPAEPGFIEISYDENFSSAEAQDNYSFDDNSSSYEISTFSLLEKLNPSKDSTSSKNSECEETSNFSAKECNSKSRSSKGKKGIKKTNMDKKLSSSIMSRIQNVGRTRNLRLKPLKKYTWNSIEIKSFVENAEESCSSKVDNNQLVTDFRRNLKKKLTTQSSKEFDIENSYSKSCNNKSLKNRKSNQRNRKRAKFVRQNKISRMRKFASSSKIKTDVTKEMPSRTARFSSRNARRRNYARIASGDYDLLEFEKIRREKKVEGLQNEKDEDDIKETDDDTMSDSSAAPIEISYKNPAAPKSVDYDFDGVSSNYTETDDDMKPHTFNLIPASRRLKMLKKRAISPSGEETPTKQITLPSQSNNEQSVSSYTKSSSLDINALKKVLAAHENSGNLTSSSLSDASDNAKEMLDSSDRLYSSCSTTEIKETKQPFLIPPRSVLEKKVMKPKMKLSEASTIENLHSLLSRVKEGDLKRFSSECNSKKKLSNNKKKGRKNSLRPASPIVNNCNGTLIEVGSDSNSVNDDNGETCSKNSDTTNRTLLEKHEVNEKFELKKKESESAAINEERVLNIALNDLQNTTQYNASEQLIDIESADIIIGDNSEQNDEFVLTDSSTPISVPTVENQQDSTSKEAERLSHSSTISIQNDATFENENNIVVKTKNEENIALQGDLKSIKMDDQQIESTAPVETCPGIEKTSVSAHFRYEADSNDLSLTKTSLKSSHSFTTSGSNRAPTPIDSSKRFSALPIKNPRQTTSSNSKMSIDDLFSKETSKSSHLITNPASSGVPTIINSTRKFGSLPIKNTHLSAVTSNSKTDAGNLSLKQTPFSSSSSHPITASVPSGVPTIINSSKKFGTLSIKNTRPIIASDSKNVNSGINSLQNKANDSNLIANSAFSKNRPFVLLEAGAITGSKSLLKPFKILQKTTVSNKTSADATSAVQKTKTIGIYSSLKNLNEFVSSTSSDSVKGSVVLKSLAAKKIDPCVVNSNGTIVLKPAIETNSKILSFSQVLENSFKFIKTADNNSATTMVNGPENNDEIIEISSNDSFEASNNSNDGNSESIPLSPMVNDMKTFFSKNIIRKQL